MFTRLSFRRIDIVGSFPEMNGSGAAYFIASNHTNTLMDALVILQARKEATSFGARADVFRNPAIARFLYFCKIVPLARKGRESNEEVSKNGQTMGQINNVVAHGVPFCLFPEGRHRPMHSLLKMKRGLSIMSYKSAQERPTYIVPVGLEYSDWFHFRSHAKMTIGEPIDVNAFLATLPDASDSSIRDAAMQDILFERLSSLILYLPDDDTYPERLAEIEARQPKRPNIPDIIIAAITSPLFALSAVLSLPLWAIAEYICHRVLKDKAFSNTARFAVQMVGMPIFALIWALILFLTLPWWLALALLILYFPSYTIFYDWLNLVNGRTNPPLSK